LTGGCLPRKGGHIAVTCDRPENLGLPPFLSILEYIRYSRCIVTTLLFYIMGSNTACQSEKSSLEWVNVEGISSGLIRSELLHITIWNLKYQAGPKVLFKTGAQTIVALTALKNITATRCPRLLPPFPGILNQVMWAYNSYSANSFSEPLLGSDRPTPANPSQVIHMTFNPRHRLVRITLYYRPFHKCVIPAAIALHCIYFWSLVFLCLVSIIASQECIILSKG
jgi:hypothetical protein